jgi:hypothetical protein
VFYALSWSVTFVLLALWSLAAWAFDSIAVWTVSNAGAAEPRLRDAAHAGARRHLMHVAAVVALLGALAPAAALAIRAAQMSPLALGVNVAMLALSAAVLAMMIRSFVVARRSRTAG